jgi:hypothetical protein
LEEDVELDGLLEPEPLSPELLELPAESPDFAAVEAPSGVLAASALGFSTALPFELLAFALPRLSLR